MGQARQWHRPYSHPELWVVAAVIVLLCGVAVTPALTGEMSWVAAAAIAVIPLGLAARVVHTGLFVGPPGVQIRTMLRTSTYDWLQIADFVTVRDRGRTGLVLQLASGSTVPTPIAIQRRARDWHERRRFRLYNTFEATLPLMGSVTYEKLVATLRHRLAEARSGR